jgi:hypothetical protein
MLKPPSNGRFVNKMFLESLDTAVLLRQGRFNRNDPGVVTEALFSLVAHMCCKNGVTHCAE